MNQPVKLPEAPAFKKVAEIRAVVEAARTLTYGWSQSGFYDRQDPGEAFALHDALIALGKLG